MSLYEELNNFWQRERQTSELIKLKPDFFERTRNYINHLYSQTNNEEDELLQELFQKRWERVTYLVNDLVKIRIQKHLKQILSSEVTQIDEQQLPAEDREFREKLQQLTRNFMNRIHGTEELQEKEPEDSDEFMLIMMKEADTQGIVGVDTRIYGPLKSNDIVFLPEVSAKNLMKQSKAERIRIN